MKALSLVALTGVFVLIGCGSSSEQPVADNNAPKPTAASPSASATTASFEAAKTVLTANCLGCHSGPGAKEGIDYSSYDTIMKGGHEGPVVVAGDPANSMIIKAMRGNGAKQMPPGKSIAEDQIKIVEDWIQAGAKNE